jgi:hypothetical protein
MMDGSYLLSVHHCDIVYSVHFDLSLGAGGVTGVLICHIARNGQRRSQNTVQIKPKHVALITNFTKLSCLTVIHMSILMSQQNGAQSF